MKVIFFVIIAVLVGITFYLSGSVKKGNDFLVPSGGLPVIVVAFSLAATQFGSSILIGGVQLAQMQPTGQGFWPAIYTLIAASLSCFLASFVAPRYRTFGESVTPPDFVQVRYGKSRFMRTYHTVVYVCSVTSILVSQLVGFANIGTVAGFQYEFLIILGATVVCLLALGSGMLGISVTDTIQYALILILLLLSTKFSLNSLSSVGLSFRDVFSEEFFPSADMKGKFFYIAIPMFIGNLLNYEYFMRFMSCKGIKEARKATILAGVILAAAAVPVALLGSVSNYMYQGSDNATVFGQMITNEMPYSIRIALIVTVLMAILTTADGMLTSISGMISRDIYGGIMHPDVPAAQLPHTRKVARITIVVFSIVAAIFALRFTEILKITFYFSPLTGGVMFAPMIVGLFWKRASRKGAIASLICAASAGILHLTGIITLFDRVAGPALIGTAVMIIVSLIFPDNKELKSEDR